MAKNTKSRPVSNPAFAAAMREIGRSSAASRHTMKKFKGSRQSNLRSAIRDHA